jgi:benzylsuccinate CoA-transferase BbsF subunit
MWAGPYATKLLAEMGAEVYKIESPRAWDNIRTLIPQPGVADPWNSSYYFNEYNRDKKSVVVDLSEESGRDAFLRLVRHCDVVIENYRADVLDKLRLGYEELRTVRDDVILVSMAAFGKSGADRDLVGFGPVIEMMSGLASLSGYENEDEPYKTGVSYCDPVAGVHAAGAVALALLRRHHTGRGAYVDLAQREGAAVLAGEAFVRASLHGETKPPHLGNRSPRWAPQGAYRCRGDEQWLVLAVTSDREWQATTAIIGREDLAAMSLEQRRDRHDEIDELLQEWAAALEPQTAMEVLQRSGVPAGRVLDTGRIHDDPHLVRRGFWVQLPHPRMHPYNQAGITWRLVDCNPALRRHSPLFGEHTREVLTTVAGLSDTEVDELYAAAITSQEPVDPGVG